MEDWYNIVTSVDKSRIVLMIRKFHHVSDFQWRYILWMNECSTDKGARPELLVTLRALLLYHRNLVHIFAYNEWQKQKETIENSINMLKLYQSKKQIPSYVRLFSKKIRNHVRIQKWHSCRKRGFLLHIKLWLSSFVWLNYTATLNLVVILWNRKTNYARLWLLEKFFHFVRR